MQRLYIFLILTLSCFILISCANHIAPQQMPNANWLAKQTGEDEKAFARGRAAFLGVCNQCHFQVWPKEQPPKEWKHTLRSHRGRVIASKEKMLLIENYIITASELIHAGKTPQ